MTVKEALEEFEALIQKAHATLLTHIVKEVWENYRANRKARQELRRERRCERRRRRYRERKERRRNDLNKEMHQMW